MGTGNFGTAFEAVIRKSGEMDSLRGELTPEQKRRRVVLKRVNVDNEGIRSNFLSVGTVARGAAETGQVESYMYRRVSRNLFVRPYCADFKGVFFADRSVGSITVGSQYLVWNFETDSTLADAIEGRLGAFPDSISDIFVSNAQRLDDDERNYRTVQQVLRKIATGVKRLHSIGIVHRDIKPENLLLTSKGDVKIIDFGAAADMSTNINFNPLVGMLDPRYSPPEEFIVPQSDGALRAADFPRAPFPWMAIILAPAVWQLGRPDLFDAFRNDSDADEYTSVEDNIKHGFLCNSCDFRLLDMRNGAGWDLAKKLIRRRNGILRGRLSVDGALNARYFG